MANAERLKVLVVEDDPAYRALAREALLGHDCRFASSAREGVELFAEHEPDIVFLDLSLPDDNGLETLLEIRERQPEAFVVILTASRLTDDVLLAQRCAANGYVTKPFSRKQLRGQCESCAEHWQKLARMGAPERNAFRARQREQAEQMQMWLHTPTPQSRAALQKLLPSWQVMVAGSGDALEWVRILGEAGCQVSHRREASEVMEALRLHPHRLLLTEDTLPDSDAAELLYRLRVNHLLLPAIVVVDEEWKLRQPKWRKVGANRLLCAPLPAEKLRAMVEKEVARSLHEIDEIFLQL